MAGEVAEALDIDATDLLDEHSSRGAIDIDLRPERRRFGTRRCGRHQNHRPREERVGLHDDAEATPSLFVPHPPGESQSKDVTPTHEGSP